MAVVTGLSGTRYQLTAQFKTGGEGTVWHTDKAGLLAKTYHKPTPELEGKLRYMVNKQPGPQVLSQIAWPQDVIYDANHRFTGLIMRKLDITDELDPIYNYPPSNSVFSLQKKLIIAQNISAVIAEIHRVGYVFGDFNPLNIGINCNTGLVSFLDTDTYHIVSGNVEYRCGVGFPGYVAPELLTKLDRERQNFALASLPTFTQETDNFALAVHIFRLLMNGFTPFCGIPVTDPRAQPGFGNDAVKRDSYCFKQGYRPLGSAVPPLQILPPDAANLFARAFIQGRTQPSARPCADEWRKPLEQYEANLKACNQNPLHQYYHTLNGCPWCEADKRYKQAITGQPVAQWTFAQASPVSQQRTFAQASPVSGTSVSQSSQSMPIQQSASSSSQSKPIPQPAPVQKRSKLLPIVLVGLSLLIFIIVLMNNQSGAQAFENSFSAQSSESSIPPATESTSAPVQTPAVSPPQERPIPDNFVRIQSGTFTMGSPANEAGRYSDEGPQHQVTVSAFSIGKYEVTVANFRTFVQATGYKTDAETSGGASVWAGGDLVMKADANWKNPYFTQTENSPVICVSWNDAVNYCNWKSRQEGLTPAYTISGTSVSWNRSANGYRLPTEAEWEYACRAGTTTPYSSGSLVDNAGWYDSNSGGKTHSVGTKQANAWGLYDMHGNVYEWCWDWFGDYSSGVQTDPVGTASESYRVLRGGSWYSNAAYLRSANRGYSAPADRGGTLGFRVVRP
ncbi:SUMF1/EgtB/PvdO family nonheme iron enzyme [Breznakiellaceae bacterium SP9]